MTQSAPYGSWDSPVGTDLLTGATIGLSAPSCAAGTAFWLEAHPEQGGRIGLWSSGEPDATPLELTPDSYLRSTVNEYGGGAYAVDGGLVAYVDFPWRSVHTLEAGATRRIAAIDRVAFGGLVVDAARRRVLAVREDHRVEGGAVTTLVELDVDGDNPEGGRTLAQGADFYASPAVRGDGALAWVEWNHPAMPWDETRLVVRLPERDLPALEVTGHSILYPRWAPDGALLYLSDASGYWNFWRWDGGEPRAVHADPHDFEGPMWVLGGGSYVPLDDERIGCTWFEDGRQRLGILAFGASGESALTPLPIDCVTASLSGDASGTTAVLGFADRPSGVYRLDWTTGAASLIRAATDRTVDPGFVSVPEAVSWPSPDGGVHGWFYPPRNAGFAAPDGELPPLQVLSHGGPTGLATPALNWSIQYWTSRGIAVLDVNYGGSAGYGRAYRERLRGSWGLTDVRDCAAGVEALARAGRIDPERVFIRGGSAGGYTTLQSLVSVDTYKAGISLYGIGDLELLATDTHKFESRYLDGLVAPYPAQRQVYLDRSPVHHLDRLSCPMLILQGLDDKVVPPNQAEGMAAAVRAKGLPVALVEYAGEGHGFRKAETIAHSVEAMLSFAGQVFGFTPAGDIAPLAVENLGAQRAGELSHAPHRVAPTRRQG